MIWVGLAFGLIACLVTVAVLARAHRRQPDAQERFAQALRETQAVLGREFLPPIERLAERLEEWLRRRR